MNTRIHKIFLTLSFIISILILFVSCYALSTPGFYSKESSNWQQQCYGQDLIDLVLITPLLMLSALLMLNGRMLGRLSWPGIMIYLVYTFVIYCFDVRFNGFFVAYCLILGLGVYGLLFFLYKQIQENNAPALPESGLIRLIAIFFAATGVVFYFLWLADIVPAIHSHSLPASVKDAGLPTNPVHVIDLSVILPLFLITALLLHRNNKLGFILAPSLLVFSTLMDLTILALNLLMQSNAALSAAFGILALFSFILFIAFARHYPGPKLTLSNKP